MPNITESQAKKPAKKKKLCLKCGRVKDLTDYYANRDWDEQLGKDVWCKDCVNRCATKDDIKEYFWENHRLWDERIWQVAQQKAEQLAANNITYQKATEDRKRGILERLTAQSIPASMQTMYKYFDPAKDGKTLSYREAKEQGRIVEEDDDDIKTYSKMFNGKFKRHELEYLEDYYTGLESEFELNDTNLRDIARKLAKASLNVDKAMDDYAAGRCDFSVVKEATAQFDLLSKTGNFAACKRKPIDTVGMGSWSELTLYLETNGHPCTRKIEWEKDDVDRTLSEFRYTFEALGLDSV